MGKKKEQKGRGVQKRRTVMPLRLRLDKGGREEARQRRAVLLLQQRTSEGGIHSSQELLRSCIPRNRRHRSCEDTTATWNLLKYPAGSALLPRLSGGTDGMVAVSAIRQQLSQSSQTPGTARTQNPVAPTVNFFLICSPWLLDLSSALFKGGRRPT